MYIFSNSTHNHETAIMKCIIMKRVPKQYGGCVVNAIVKVQGLSIIVKI